MSANSRSYSVLVPFLSCCALAIGGSCALFAQTTAAPPVARILVTQPVDSNRLVTVAGNTRPEANVQNDRGVLPDNFPLPHMLLQLQRSPEREQALRNFIDQQHDSASPNFHKWLTAEQFGQLYGPAPQDIEAVSEWLRASGFTVNILYPSGMVLDFSGTAGQVQRAFKTEIHRLSVEGKDHIANMSDPQIPEALAPVVTGIVSLHDFRPRSLKKPAPRYSLEAEIVVPDDLATIYDLKPAFAAGITGKGQTIAVLEDSNLYNTQDWYNFRKIFALTSYTAGSLSTLNPAPPHGTSNCSDPGSNGDDDETTLDAEWASAAAPDAKIEVATCAGSATTAGPIIAAENIINSSHPPSIISISYIACEAANGAASNAAQNSAFQQAVSEGISVFVASGDAGGASCDMDSTIAIHGIGVNSIASTPYNVAVGGTDFGDTYQHTNSTYWGPVNSATYGSALSYIPEIPWNDSCAGTIAAAFWGFSTGYGSAGYCGSSLAQLSGALTTGAGGGGPSGCATGASAENFVVGGSCKGYAKPSWQTGVPGIQNDGVRDLPDVALFAADGLWGHSYVFCFSDPANGGVPCEFTPDFWPGGGGTSFASPIMAGIQALVNQKMGGPQGNPNPVYYKLAASSVASSVFHSITAGDIAVNCSGDISCFGAGFVGRGRSYLDPFDGNGALSRAAHAYAPAFAAGAGWNFATGLGSVDAFNLITNWSTGQ